MATLLRRGPRDPTTTLILDGRLYSVSGVAHPGFDFPLFTDRVLGSFGAVNAHGPRTGVARVSMIARLADGVSLEAATAEANVIGAYCLPLMPRSRDLR